VAKIRKIAPILLKEKLERSVNVNEEIRTYKGHFHAGALDHAITLYEHTGKILALKTHPSLETLRKKYYFMRF